LLRSTVPWGIQVPVAYDSLVEAGSIFVVSGAYYEIVRVIETKYPKAGWLLGVPKAPTYSV
jgi:hypothetical protein